MKPEERKVRTLLFIWAKLNSDLNGLASILLKLLCASVAATLKHMKKEEAQFIQKPIKKSKTLRGALLLIQNFNT